MAWGNKTTVTEFVLLGLSPLWEVQLVFFVFFFFLYMITVFSNLLILLTICKNHHLSSSPMFYLLGHLAFLDLCLSSFAMPRAIFDFFAQRQTISFQDCMAQIFFLHLFAGSEMLLLVAMAYDRYVAICHPFQYNNFMSRRHCVALVLASWAGGLIHTCVQLGFILSVPFCGPNRVDSFFCEIPFIIKLACADLYPLEVMKMTNSGIISLVSFTTLLVSYGLILSAVCSRNSSDGTSKAISTCSAHFMVVTMYFGPCLVIYMCPFTLFTVDKVLFVFYTTMTPFLNPAIYALKSKKMKAAMGRLLARCSGKISAQISNISAGGLAFWRNKEN